MIADKIKRNKILPLIGLLTVMMLFSACNLFFPKLEMLATTVPLTLTIDSSTARTIGYTISDPSTYELTGVKNGGETSIRNSWTFAEMSQGAVIGLEAGTWTFTLQGKDGDGNILLEGIIEDRVITEPENLHFLLKTLGTGTGTVDISVNWPISSSVAAVETTIDGVILTPALSITPDAGAGTSGVSLFNEAVPAGDKVLVFKLFTSENNLIASVTERLRVRGNLTSSKTIDLQGNQLNAPPSAPSSITANCNDRSNLDNADVSLSWTDSSATETGFILQYSSDSGENWTALTSTEAGINSFLVNEERGNTLLYKVQAFNSFGSSDWTVSEALSVPVLEENSNDDFTYTVSGNEVTITGYTGSAMEVIIPAAIEDHPVTVIGASAFKDSSITYAYIPEGVRSLGSSCFQSCSSLEQVILPSALENIPSSCFYSCSSLSEINLPENLKGIDTRGFYNCNALLAVSLPDSLQRLEDYAYDSCSGLESVHIGSALTPFTGTVFTSCSSLREFEVSDLCTAYASENGVLFNKNKTSLILYPAAKDEIAYQIPESVTSLQPSCFHGAQNLQELSIGENISSIDASSLGNTSSLTSITVDTSNNHYCSINRALFNKAASELIRYPASATNSSFTVPDGVVSIGNSAFAGSSFLSNIVLPSSVDSLGSYCFATCSLLDELFLPNGITTIGIWAFNGCSALDTITLPATIESIGDRCFFLCNNLTEINLERLIPPTLGTAPFASTSPNLKIYVETQALPSYKSDPGWSDYSDIIDTKEDLTGASFTITFDANGGVGDDYTQDMVYENTATLPACGFTRSGYTFVGWSTIEKGIGSFYTDESDFTMNCYDLTLYACWLSNSANPVSDFTYDPPVDNAIQISTYIGNDNTVEIPGFIEYSGTYYPVTAIKDSPYDAPAFGKSTTLTSVILPDSMMVLGDYAFSHCSALASVDLGSSLVEISRSAFMDCSQLPSIDFPDTLQIIGMNAFRRNYALETLHLPASLKQIGSEVFEGCSSLTGFTVDENSTYFAVSDGILFNADFTELVLYPKGKSGNSYTIPSSVKTIRTSAFLGTDLSSIEIPEGVEDIEPRAFNDCENLTMVSLPDTITELGYMAFYGCDALERIELGNSLEEIGSNAFNYCHNLTEVYITTVNPPALSTSVFDNNAVDRKIYVPVGSSSAYKTAQNWSSYADSIEPDYDAIYGNIAFTITYKANGGLGDDYTQTVIYKETDPLASCSFSNLEGIFIGWSDSPNGAVLYNDQEAFTMGHEDLTLYALWGGKVTFDANGGSEDNYTQGMVLGVETPLNPCSFTKPNYLFNGWASEPEGNAVYADEENYLLIDTAQTLYAHWVSNITALYDYTITEGKVIINEYLGDEEIIEIPETLEGCPVTIIGSRAFFNNISPKSITIPNTVTTIEMEAFSNMSRLESCNIPPSVTTIGEKAFYNDKSLTTITIPASVTSIGARAFTLCNGLTEVNMESSTPPVLEDEHVFITLGSFYIYVPDGAVDDYLKDDIWADNYGSRIKIHGYRYLNESNVLTSPVSGTNFHFGSCVCLSEDGNIMAVRDINGGSDFSSVVHMFKNEGGWWSHLCYFQLGDFGSDICEPGAYFADSMALSADGSVLLIGSYKESKAYIFTSSNLQVWNQTAFLTPEATVEDTRFGYSVDLSDDGKVALIGAYSIDPVNTEGLAYIYETASIWTSTTETAVLNFSQGSSTYFGAFFGKRVALSGDGKTAAIGAYGDNSEVFAYNAYYDRYMTSAKSGAIFSYSSEGTWSSMTETDYIYVLGLDDNFGTSVDLSQDGSTLLGAGNKAAYIFEKEGGEYEKQAVLIPSDTTFYERSNFGISASLSSDGSRVLIGDYINGTSNDYQYGAAYFYEKKTNWSDNAEIAKIRSSYLHHDPDAFFANSLQLAGDGSFAVIGAWQDDNNTNDSELTPGVVYTVDLD